MIGCIAGRRAWLAVLAALASGGAAAGTLGSDCDQRFDVDTPASRGGDPAITELGCSHDAASANYCIALPGAPPDGFEAAPAAPGQ